MLINSLFLLALILSVMCLSSTTITTVEAYSVNFPNGSTLSLDPKYFSGSFPNMQQTGLAPNTFAWQFSLLAASNFNGACSSRYFAAEGSACELTFFPEGPTSIVPNSDGSGVEIILQTTYSGNPWKATFNVVCDPTATTLKSPTNSYQASRPASIVIAFNMVSAGACLSRNPPPSPPSPPPPSPSPCTGPKVQFPNGSSITLCSQDFVAEFPQIHQSGFAPSNYDWKLSLVDASNFNGACNNSYFAAQGQSCRQANFPSPATSIKPNDEISGVEFFFETDFAGYTWQATFNVLCSTEVSKLTSPSNSYQAAMPSTTILLSFVLTSPGACVSTQPPPTPHNLNPKLFEASFPNMKQTGLAPGQYLWDFSLVNPWKFNCPAMVYMAQGSACDEMTFTNTPFISPNAQDNGYNFVLTGLDGSNRPWQANVNVLCNFSATSLISPSNSYKASMPAETILLEFNLASVGACAPPSPSPPPSPPSPPSSATTVVFNNGSKLTLFPQFFTTTIPNFQQTGITPKPFSWSFSLVQKSDFGGSCSGAPGFVGEGPNCNLVVFNQAATSATPNSDGSGVLLRFHNASALYGLSWDLEINVVCNPEFATMKSLTNKYVATQGQNGEIKASMDFVSRGACLSDNKALLKLLSKHHTQRDHGSTLFRRRRH